MISNPKSINRPESHLRKETPNADHPKTKNRDRYQNLTAKPPNQTKNPISHTAQRLKQVPSLKTCLLTLSLPAKKAVSSEPSQNGQRKSRKWNPNTEAMVVMTVMPALRDASSKKQMTKEMMINISRLASIKSTQTTTHLGICLIIQVVGRRRNS